MTTMQKPVLISGCSAGGIGKEALAAEFYGKGWVVFATVRNLKKVQHLDEAGWNILELDITNESTIKAAVKEVELRAGGKLDIVTSIEEVAASLSTL